MTAEIVAILAGILLVRALACGFFRLDLIGRWALQEDPDGRVRPEAIRPAEGGRSTSVPLARPLPAGEPGASIWLCRAFEAPEVPPEHGAALAAEAFAGRAEVYLNGLGAGALAASEVPQAVDLSEGLRPGRNILALRLPCSCEGEAPGGPLDRIALAIRPRVHLGRARIHADATGLLAFSIALTGPLPCEAGAEADLVGPDGRIVRRWRLPLAEGADRIEEEGARIPEPRLWSLRYPSQYELRVRLRGPALGEDEARYRFGFRSVEARDGGLVLNGIPVWTRGVHERGVWPEWGPVAPPQPAIRDALRRVKGLGCNLVRVRGSPPAARYLRAADEVGLLVWYEILPPSRGRSLELIRAAVERDANRPSIVAFGIRGRLPAAGAARRGLCGIPRDWLGSGPGEPAIDVRRAFRESGDAWVSEAGPPRGGAAVRLAEIGAWGLPALREPEAEAPGGRGEGPEGAVRRFREHRLDLAFGDLAGLAAESQAAQAEALREAIERLRVEGGLGGVLIRSLADGRRHADGLLTADRREKAFATRAAHVLADDAVVIRPARASVWAGDPVEAEVFVAHGSGRGLAGGGIVWQAGRESGAIDLAGPIPAGISRVGSIRFGAPATTRLTRTRVEMLLRTVDRYTIGRGWTEIAVYPRSRPPRVSVWIDPGLPGAEELAERLRARGLSVATEAADARVRLRPRIRYEDVPEIGKGRRVLVLCESPDALPPACGLTLSPRRTIHPPALPEPPLLWIRTDHPACAGVSTARILAAESGQVRPALGIRGVDPAHFDDVLAGAFRGWLRAPVAFTVQAKVGFGRVVFTTLRLRAPYGEDPCATVALERLIEHLAGEYCRPRLEPALSPVIEILRTAREGRGEPGGSPLWRHTFDPPGEGWADPGFDDGAWRKGKGGFGRRGNPIVPLGTTWETPEIWLRARFALQRIPSRLIVILFHDEAAEIFVNGRRVLARQGYSTDYLQLPAEGKPSRFLHEGENVIAVHCRQSGRTQTLDVGLRGIFSS